MRLASLRSPPLARLAENAGSSICDTCPSGTFANLPSQSSCTPCGAGRYLIDDSTSSTEHVSESQCLTCPAGYFSSLDATSTCSACPGGKYLSDDSTDSLLHDSLEDCNLGLCSAGKFGPPASTSLGDCQNCLSGTYQPLPGQPSCNKTCPVGESPSSFVEGATSISQLSCLTCLCAIGQTCAEAGGCHTCAAGKFAATVGAISCTNCEPGKYSTSGASTCNICAPGQVPSPSQDSCETCGVGNYSISGDVSCRVCDASRGEVSNSHGASACSLCGPGRFADKESNR